MQPLFVFPVCRFVNLAGYLVVQAHVVTGYQEGWDTICSLSLGALNVSDPHAEVGGPSLSVGIPTPNHTARPCCCHRHARTIHNAPLVTSLFLTRAFSCSAHP
jgi:hypothetical protein